jgi:hypothetical protein
MPGSGATGFGIGGDLPAPHVTVEQMQIAAGDLTALLQSMEKSLSRLADKYVEQGIEQPNVFTITGSAITFSQKFDYSTQRHNSLILCVFAGTLNLFLGDYSGQPQGTVPNCGQFGAGPPVQLFFPLKGRVYTVINPSTTIALTASVIPVAI